MAGSIACDLHEVRFVVVEDAQRHDPASKSLGIEGMPVHFSLRCRSLGKMDDLYVFYHVPKCGGTTVSRIIDRVYDPSVLYAVNPSTRHFEASLRALRQKDHESISRLRMIRGHQTYGLDKIFERPSKYITILREPGRRFVSSYFHAIHQPDSHLGRRLREANVTLKQLAGADDEVLGRDYLVRSFAAVPEAAHPPTVPRSLSWPRTTYPETSLLWGLPREWTILFC
jgi:sulfotransferase famil protein